MHFRHRQADTDIVALCELRLFIVFEYPGVYFLELTRVFIYGFYVNTRVFTLPQGINLFTF